MQYKRFCDFADEPPLLDGAKVKIDDLINKEILVVGYRITDSKYTKNNNSKCLTIQFQMEEKKHIVFTGSRVLIDQIQKYKEEIPFLAVIKKIDRYLSFA